MSAASQEAIEKAKSMFQTPGLTTAERSRFDLERYLAHYGIEIIKKKTNGTSTLYCLRACVIDPTHAPNDAAIGVTGDGKLFYQCFHDSCQGRTWKEAREKISGTDSLTPFMLGVSRSPRIYSKDTKDRSDNAGLARVSEIDPSKCLRTGAELQTLECSVTWLWDKQIPEQSITILHGRGGTGKTWLMLGIANAVSKGLLHLGLATKKMPVYYIDFENSLPVLVERLKKLGITDVLFWHNTNEIRPPRIDTPEWELYKRLPPGLLIFDTLRACQGKDENDSKDMALVMGRLKELRDKGFTIVLLHHTPKSNDRTYKGSTAIFDLSDHVLGLYEVRKGKPEEILDDDDDNADACYRIGTKDKTRYEPFHMFITFDPEHGFVVAPDPDTDDLEAIETLLRDKGRLNQSQIYELVKEIGITSKGRLVNLLKKGTGKYWTSFKEGKAIFYEPKGTVQVSSTIYSQTVGQMEERHPDVSRQIDENEKGKTVDKPVLSKCPEERQTDETDPIFLDGLKLYMKNGLTRDEAAAKVREYMQSIRGANAEV